MPNSDFFPQRPKTFPQVYAYVIPGLKSHEGYIKVGYTERENASERIHEQLHTAGIKHDLLFIESAMRPDGSSFTDHDVHKVLRRKGYPQLNEGEDRNEWFKCSAEAVRAAIIAVRDRTENAEERSQSFPMRPEQARAVRVTMDYFQRASQDEPGRRPKFLWNAKMRFGKTFASYELAKAMGLKRILVLTFKPAVESAWREDLMTHVDFEGWQFVSNKDAHNNNLNIDEQYAKTDKGRPIVVFGSFQDLLGTNENGGIKAKNEFIHTDNWDLVIFDEYHFGAWRENAAKLFERPDEEKDVDFDAEEYSQEEAGNAFNETFIEITTKYYLFLSGTPFRALNSGEFIEEQIYNWTYSDEQRAKEQWPDLVDFPEYHAQPSDSNPYAALPRMVMLTYRIPESIRRIAQQGEFNEFDLNEFFAAKPEEKGKPETSRFVHENEVQKWLDLIRGAYLPSTVDDLKLDAGKRPPMPYSDVNLQSALSHTLWFLPNVASCYAMGNLLVQRQNNFYHKYKVLVCAGTKAGIGLDALTPIRQAMGNPLETQTITLSCGKLTTGVTVKPWSGVFMLRNLKSPETYFQTAFRVQSPWTIQDNEGRTQIIKQECYIFDFALDRALRQISDYARNLDVNSDKNPEEKVAEFIQFLPVLAYSGSSMQQVDAEAILDIAMSGTSATLLARRWQSALLVNVDNTTLQRLLDSKEALDALSRIEDFRNLNQDLEIIINKSNDVRDKKKKREKLPPEEKKRLSDEEKEFKTRRREIQKKLIKFASRIPLFMYLTDYREKSLKDVITQIEPGLFMKVTGLDNKDFELLCSLGVFNAGLMTDSILKFRRYEDASLSYAGIDKNADKAVGGWDTVLRREEYEKLYYSQQTSMAAVEQPEEDEEPEPVVKAKETASRTQEPKKETAPAATKVVPAPTPTVTKAPPMWSPALKKPAYTPPSVKAGDTVMHKKFGKGTIASLEIKAASKYIRVQFVDGEKTFIFPDAFKNGFLTVE